MSDLQSEEKLLDRLAIKHLAILITIAAVIGVYLIITTVLISKDGVFYIERAQNFMDDPVKTIKAHPPGYPFLIVVMHKTISFFTHDNSNQGWIYSAQIVTLLCRLLALIPLYFIGKLLVGSKNSFLALLILIILPFPVKAACEVLREWPYILFLATGFFFLLWATRSGKWWAFGIVGFASGLGYMIRPETGQLMIFGLLWAGGSLFRPGIWALKKTKVIAALVLLLLSFATSVVPYMSYLDSILPPQVKDAMRHFSFNEMSYQKDALKVNTNSVLIKSAEVIPNNVLNGLGEIFSSVGENLMWFFMLPLAVGLYCRFRGNLKKDELFLMPTFILVSLTMMLFRFCFCEAHISQRWTLPMVALTIFYIPLGLNIMANWLNANCTKSKEKVDTLEDRRSLWFAILFIVGIGICMPKLLRPVGVHKQGYREAANWVRQNTAINAVVVVPNKRIGFYADRNKVVTESPVDCLQWDYYVKLRGKDEEGGEVSYWVDQRRKKKKVVVYPGREK